MADDDPLGRIAVFGALNPDSIAFLRERAEKITRKEGEVFFSEGDSGDSLYVLESGEVVVEKSRGDTTVALATLASGDCFGEMALMAITPRTATVRALCACEALRLRNAALLELYKRDVEQFALLQMNLGREIARRLTIADEVIFQTLRETAESEITAPSAKSPIGERIAGALK